jgi:ADP-heptose:LPS heptosyltransferase
VRILVSRTDRIGDVVLTLPLCGLLKAELGATVVALGRRYTRPVLEACDAVDEVLEWDDAAPGGARRALLAAAGADAILHVFPRRAIAVDAWRARIPTRVGTSRRAYHWLTCNRLEPLSRRGSALHEAQLNVRSPARCCRASTTRWPSSRRTAGSRRACPCPADVAPLLAPDRFTLVVHPRSLGSGREWPLAAWARSSPRCRRPASACSSPARATRAPRWRPGWRRYRRTRTT